MCHYDDVLATFELHDDGLKTDDNVSITLTSSIPIIVLVFVSGLEVFWIPVFDLLISKAITNARIELVKCFPFKFIIAFVGSG